MAVTAASGLLPTTMESISFRNSSTGAANAAAAKKMGMVTDASLFIEFLRVDILEGFAQLDDPVCRFGPHVV